MARVVVLQKQGHPSFSILSFSVSDFDGARLHNHISWDRTPLPKAALQVTASRFPVKDSRQVLTTSFISVYCFCSFFFFHIVEDIEINCLRTLIICILLWFLDDDFVQREIKLPVTRKFPGESLWDYADCNAKNCVEGC